MQSSKKTNERKKVLIVPSWYPSQADPINGIFIQEQAHALAAQYDVAVLIPRMRGWRNVLTSNISFKTDENGVPVFREYARPLIPHGPAAVDYHTFARAASKGFYKVVNEFGMPDIIHAHVVLPGGWCALKLGERHSIPVVLTEHSSPFSMHLDTTFKRRLVKETLRGVDQVIAVSPALAEQMLAFDRRLRVRVIGNLIRTDFFVPAQNGQLPTRDTITQFFTVARLAEQKGLGHLIRALQLVQQRATCQAELWIGGDGPDRLKLERLARDLDVTQHCHFLGQLNREQVRDWMQRSDVLVLSSLHETFGVVIGEAMACGKPVIATRCGGPESFVNSDNGVLVDTGSPEALADAMADFISNGIRFDSKTVRASVVTRFGPDAFLKAVSGVYEELWTKRDKG
jgi:L-malate glycosyltransferase